MSLKGKIAIISVAAVLGGYGLAYAEGYPNVAQDTFASQTAAQTTTAQPDTTSSTPVDTQATSPNVNDSAPSVDVAPTNVNTTPVAKPAPTPKPATVYSTTRSADTPCRLYTEAIYTNDCDTPAPKPAAQTVDTTPTPDPTPAQDPSQTVVSNPNH